MTTSYIERIPSVLSVAEAAATAIVDIYRRKAYQVQSKLDNSPVTEADLRAHEILTAGLSALDPALPVISEEGEVVPFELRSQWPRFWLIDPLDGTREFIQGTGEFTINIALIENHQPVLGVVLVPERQHVYWAVRGAGAFFQMQHAAPVPLQSHLGPRSPLKVLMSRRLNQASKPAWIALSQRLGAYELDYCGSALKICRVAQGEADLYPCLGPTREWDTAAGQCILEEAGGQLIDLEGKPLQYNTKSTLKRNKMPNIHFSAHAECRATTSHSEHHAAFWKI